MPISRLSSPMPTPIDSSSPTTTPAPISRAPLPAISRNTSRLRRADGEADADLAPAHADQIRQHAVAADAGQRQRQRAEDDQQIAGQLLLERRRLGVIGEPADVVERHLRIELAHRALQSGRPSRRARRPSGRAATAFDA